MHRNNTGSKLFNNLHGAIVHLTISWKNIFLKPTKISIISTFNKTLLIELNRCEWFNCLYVVEEEASWALKYKRRYEKGKNEKKKKDQREGKAAGKDRQTEDNKIGLTVWADRACKLWVRMFLVFNFCVCWRFYLTWYLGPFFLLLIFKSKEQFHVQPPADPLLWSINTGIFISFRLIRHSYRLRLERPMLIQYVVVTRSVLLNTSQ